MVGRVAPLVITLEIDTPWKAIWVKKLCSGAGT
jgi:hypothetical protein